MKIKGIILIAWWLYVSISALVPFHHGFHFHGHAGWVARQRFLHREFCEVRAKQLRREGQRAICLFVDDF